MQEDTFKPKLYRDFIDKMVEVCHDGQGQIGPNNTRKGIWNENATEDFLKDQHEVNLLLKSLGEHERNIIARLLEEAFQGGVFETLKQLECFDVEPFVEGYEGSPFNDFIGRLDQDDQWEWPE